MDECSVCNIPRLMLQRSYMQNSIVNELLYSREGEVAIYLFPESKKEGSVFETLGKWLVNSESICCLCLLEELSDMSEVE
jgi:hypothetical protein